MGGIPTYPIKLVFSNLESFPLLRAKQFLIYINGWKYPEVNPLEINENFSVWRIIASKILPRRLPHVFTTFSSKRFSTSSSITSSLTQAEEENARDSFHWKLFLCIKYWICELGRETFGETAFRWLQPPFSSLLHLLGKLKNLNMKWISWKNSWAIIKWVWNF